MVATVEAPTRQAREGDGPIREFPGGRSGDLSVQVYADHLEVISPGRIVAVWYRNLRGCMSLNEHGQAALAIVDRRGQVLSVPMESSAVTDVTWLIEGLRLRGGDAC